MEIAAFGHREIGHGDKNFAAQLPVTVVHPVRRDRVGEQRRRAQRAVGFIGDDFPRNQIVVPVGRPPVDYGYDPVIARPQFEIERARRKIPGDLQFGPWPRLCVEQDGLRRVHDPAGVRLFQDQQPGRVPEPLRVGGGARHGYERDVRADGFQPERDFDAFSLSADGCPKGSPSEQPPVRKAAITNKTESFFHNRTFLPFHNQSKFVSMPPPTGMSMIRSQCSPPVDREAICSHRKPRRGIGRRKGEVSCRCGKQAAEWTSVWPLPQAGVVS